jgi:predicted DNA-binding transcriptional regulator YafY
MVRYLWEAAAVSRPTTRVLAFLELLQDHPGLGGRELADRLEVQPRTIRRYAAALQELGIPVEAERGRAGGYRLRPGFRLPPLMLGDDEAIAVTLGLLAVRRLGVARTEPAVDGALAKVLRVLPAPLRERALALHEAVAFTAPGRESEPAPSEIVLALAQAVRRRRRVRLRHRSADGRETTREADPLGVVHHAGRWYLAAHDHLRDDLRTFRVDRILAVDERPEPAEPPAGFDAVEHVTRTLAVGGWRHEVEVVLHTTLEDARQRIPPTVGDLAPREQGDVVLRVRAERLDGMAQLLAGLGAPFTVVGPPELRDEVVALAGRLAASAASRP